jgi:Cu(I)/Ag(I) efflux system membrane protein CusA/SilA
VLEYLSKVLLLSSGVKTEIGPDATGVGWVFQYALLDASGTHTLADLRSFQDWNLRFALQAIPGVAEIATIGGFQNQYQITVDRERLAAYNIPLMMVSEAVRNSNVEVGARLIEFSGAEYMVRSHGYIKSAQDIEQIVVKTNDRGTPVLLRDIARVERGPEMRRGVADLDGKGDTVGGIVVMRHNENADKVIRRVKERLQELQPSLPKGVKVVTTYDRSELIEGSISNLKEELILEMIIVSFVILIFLAHPIGHHPDCHDPVAVLLSLSHALMGLNSNIMSLAGIAISIGVLVDGAIVEVENAYKKLELWIEGGRQGDFHAIRLEALKEVGPSVFFSLLVIAVAFLPVFTLVDQEGRLFRPLAFTKNFAMAIAAILAVTLIRRCA